MNKSKIYTILGLVLSFMVIMGGWFFTKEMLQCKEAKILAGTGVISIVETAYPLEENFQPVLLSEDIMAEILKVWEAGGYIEYHEPKEGQMNMEQAIQAGGDWIDRMVENHILPKSLLSKGFESIGAVLCLVNNNQVEDYALNNNLLSCWEIRYKTREAEINLKIHAFSGQVWEADITVHESEMPEEYYSDEQLIAVAFPFLISENKDIEIQRDDGNMYGIYEQEFLRAVFERYTIFLDNQQMENRLQLALYSASQ